MHGMSVQVRGEMSEVVRMAAAAAINAGDPRVATLRHAASVHIQGEWELLAIGKAAAAMASGAIAGIGIPPARALLVVPEGVDTAGAPGRVLISDHPLPTQRSLEAGRVVEEWVQSAHAGRRLVICLSGGASALVCLRPIWSDAAHTRRLAVEELARAADALMRAGASITELNTVRKHTEQLKGGGLARLLKPSTQCDVLVLSDVLGNDLSTIGSGPMAHDPTSAADAIAVLKNYDLQTRFDGLISALRAVAYERENSVENALRIEHHVVSSNAEAVRGAEMCLRAAGYDVRTRLMVEGEAKARGQEFGGAIKQAACAGRDTKAALVWGGETTVRVSGEGCFGGRNQEAALSAATIIDGIENVCVACIATDGVDGVRPDPGRAVHAGAAVNWQTAEHARRAGIDLAQVLRENQSYLACERLGLAVRTGVTGTNVNDVWIATV